MATSSPHASSPQTDGTIDGGWWRVGTTAFIVALISGMLQAFSLLGDAVAIVALLAAIACLFYAPWRQAMLSPIGISSPAKQYTLLSLAALFMASSLANDPSEKTSIAETRQPAATETKAIAAVEEKKPPRPIAEPPKAEAEQVVAIDKPSDLPSSPDEVEQEEAPPEEEPKKGVWSKFKERLSGAMHREASEAEDDKPLTIENRIARAVGKDGLEVEVNDYADAPGGKIVLVRWPIGMNFTDSMTRAGARLDVAHILEAIYESGIELHEATVFGSTELVDQYGKTTKEVVLKATFSSPTINRIEWNEPGIEAMIMEHILELADSHWLHPTMRD